MALVHSIFGLEEPVAIRLVAEMYTAMLKYGLCPQCRGHLASEDVILNELTAWMENYIENEQAAYCWYMWGKTFEEKTLISNYICLYGARDFETEYGNVMDEIEVNIINALNDTRAPLN